MHVHLREPGQTYKETIATGTAAAAAGGFTSVVAMPNTVPVNDSVATLEWMLDAAHAPVVRLFAMPAATRGSLGVELTDFEALARAGAVGFTDDGRPVLEDSVMRAALLRAGRLGLVISQHAEDTRVSPSSGINAGVVAFRLGLRGMSVEAESSIVERDIALLRDIETHEGVRPRLHVQHVSTARALQAIRDAKAEGQQVTCEAAPHHFTLNEEALNEFDTNCKMNPPLRAEQDRLAVLAGLLDGTVDCLATDHAPHARHEKEVEFAAAPNGITGLETALGLALKVAAGAASRGGDVHSTGADLELAAGRGRWRLAAGGDVAVFDPAETWVFQAAASRSKSKNTPFDGGRHAGPRKGDDQRREGGLPAMKYVALLRGINVGGKAKLPMKELAAIFRAAGGYSGRDLHPERERGVRKSRRRGLRRRGDSRDRASVWVSRAHRAALR